MKYQSHIIWIVATIVVALVFVWLGRSSVKCPDCPQVVSASRSVRDSVVVRYDTQRVYKPAGAFTVRRDERPEPDARQTDTHARHDSVAMYEVVDTMPDAAIIGIQLWSVALPDQVPPDLGHSAWYVAAPERMRIITDTIRLQLPPLQRSAWRDFAIAGIGIAVGAGAALLLAR